MIVENPYTQPHYLTMYFPIKPAVIVKDRHAEGDYFKKPTQFYFVNCAPEQNIVLSPLQFVPLTTKDKCVNDLNLDVDRGVKRSLMHPQFAERFIKTYVLDKEGGVWN